MSVWNMADEKFVEFRQWMRFCPFIWSKGVTNE